MYGGFVESPPSLVRSVNNAHLVGVMRTRFIENDDDRRRILGVLTDLPYSPTSYLLRYTGGTFLSF